MLKIAVCDDEPEMIGELSRRIQDFLGAEASVLFPFSGGEALLSCAESFDLVFLDIRLGGISGMETARRLRAAGSRCLLVFTTALSEYVFDAFAVEAADYLLKPLEDARFRQVMERLLRRLENQSRATLFLSGKSGCTSIQLADIRYCEAVAHRIAIHTRQQTLPCRLRMEELRNRLDSRFFQCHRSYLVNLQFVTGYSGGLAILENGEKIPVSRLRGQAFSQAILRCMKEG